MLGAEIVDKKFDCHVGDIRLRETKNYMAQVE